MLGGTTRFPPTRPIAFAGEGEPRGRTRQWCSPWNESRRDSLSAVLPPGIFQCQRIPLPENAGLNDFSDERIRMRT